MTVSYLVSKYPGVSHTFIHREVAALRRLGFVIAVASINGADCELPSEEVEPYSPVFYVKPSGWKKALLAQFEAVFSSPVGYFRGLLYALRLASSGIPASLPCLFYFIEAVMIGVWMKKNRSTHLHVHFATQAATVGLILSQTFPVSLSITVHGPDEFFDVYRFFLREKVEKAAFICAIGFYARSQLMRLVDHKHWDKILISSLGVDVEEFSRARPALDKECLDLVCVGRLVPAKGQGVLLRAVQQLVMRGRKIRLRFVGDGPDRGLLEAFVRTGELQSYVTFTGSVPPAKVREYLSTADIFVLPSFAEGIPVALMEAMSMQIPCVSTCICGIPELIESGTSGVLVSPSNLDGLIEALDRLVEDPALRASIGREGRRRVMERYQLQPNTQRLAEIFSERIPSSVSAASRLYRSAEPAQESVPLA
jgi:glycosyltransferase involved in cell wall biosynthesis